MIYRLLIPNTVEDSGATHFLAFSDGYDQWTVEARSLTEAAEKFVAAVDAPYIKSEVFGVIQVREQAPGAGAIADGGSPLGFFRHVKQPAVERVIP